MYHVFAYLNKYHDSELVIDPSDKVFDQDEFECQYWTSSDFGHASGKYDLPLNMPISCGLGFAVTVRVDADHSGDTVTRRYSTGFIIYVNSALV